MDCEGCHAAQGGRPRREHRKECVERMMRAMEEDEERRARLEAGRNRIDEEFARRLEEDDRQAEKRKAEWG